MLVLKDSAFEVKTGSKTYQLELAGGDSQVDLTLLADADCYVYIAFGETVLPVGRGSEIRGRYLVRDARWVLVRTDKASSQVAIQLYQQPRRLVDENDRKPLAVHVPKAPVLDLRAMVNRVLAERMPAQEAQIEFGDDEVAELYPDDVDTEFGPGYVQLEEDEDIEEHIRANRERAAAARQGDGGADRGEAREGGSARGGEGNADNGGGPPKRPKASKKKPEPAPLEEAE